MAAKSTSKTDQAAAENETEKSEVIDLDTASSQSPEPARTHRSPFGDLLDVFPSIFNQRWPEIFAAPGGLEPMKVEEQVDDDSYLIRAEIPGVDPEEGIDISMDNDRLTISAHREQRVEADEANQFRSEFRYGSFRRTLTLPPGADADNIKATYEDGILEVRVPIDADQPSAKKILIERTS